MEKVKLIFNKFVKPFMPIVFFIILSLNIWLVCMPVFNGEYTNNKEGVKTKLTFYGNNFDLTEKYVEEDNEKQFKCSGFYSTKNAVISLNRVSTWSFDKSHLFKDNTTYYCEFKRRSVFSFYIEEMEYTGYSYRKVDRVYTCVGAIVLQVFYAIMEAISGIITIGIFSKTVNKVIHRKINSSQKNKKNE